MKNLSSLLIVVVIASFASSGCATRNRFKATYSDGTVIEDNSWSANKIFGRKGVAQDFSAERRMASLPPTGYVNGHPPTQPPVYIAPAQPLVYTSPPLPAPVYSNRENVNVPVNVNVNSPVTVTFQVNGQQVPVGQSVVITPISPVAYPTGRLPPYWSARRLLNTEMYRVPGYSGYFYYGYTGP